MGNAAVNFEGVGFCNFRYFPKMPFCHDEVGDGNGGMHAICSRPEVADGIISGADIDTFPPVLRL